MEKQIARRSFIDTLLHSSILKLTQNCWCQFPKLPGLIENYRKRVERLTWRYNECLSSIVEVRLRPWEHTNRSNLLGKRGRLTFYVPIHIIYTHQKECDSTCLSLNHPIASQKKEEDNRDHKHFEGGKKKLKLIT